jgi:hypothetical protein
VLLFGRDNLRIVSLRKSINLDLGDLDQGTQYPLTIKFMGIFVPEKMSRDKINRDGSSCHPHGDGMLFP